jgi:hypothetical protein
MKGLFGASSVFCSGAFLMRFADSGRVTDHLAALVYLFFLFAWRLPAVQGTRKARNLLRCCDHKELYQSEKVGEHLPMARRLKLETACLRSGAGWGTAGGGGSISGLAVDGAGGADGVGSSDRKRFVVDTSEA